MSSMDEILFKISQATAALAEASKELETITQALESQGPTENARAYWGLHGAYGALDEGRKSIYEVDDKLNKLLVPQSLEKAEQDMVRIPALARSFYILKKYSATVVEGKKDDAFEWLRKNGLSAIIQPTVNAQTLTNSLKSLQLEKGVDVPDDIFNFRSYNTTGSSRYTPK